MSWIDVYMEGVEQADPVASDLEGQVAEVASRIHSLPCPRQGPQGPGQGSDTITAVWQVIRAVTAPGGEVISANLSVPNRKDNGAH